MSARLLGVLALAAAAACSGKGARGGDAGAGPRDAGPALPDATVGVIGASATFPIREVQSGCGDVEELIEVREEEKAALAPNTPAITGEKPAVPDAGPPADAAPPAAPADAAPAAPAVASNDHGDFKIVVEASANPHPLRPIAAQYVGILVDVLNSQFRLETDVPVVFTACGQPNMFYDPSSKRIIICDETLASMHEVFSRYKSEADADAATLIALFGGFLHELGHCLVDQYQLPVIGREEDAADQLAAILVLGGPDNDAASPEFGLTLAEFWLAFSVLRPESKKDRMWDEHALDEQRYYNILCLTYGSRPDAYAFIVDEGDLPRERARRCAREYTQIRKAWKGLLQPHMLPGAHF